MYRFTLKKFQGFNVPVFQYRTHGNKSRTRYDGGTEEIRACCSSGEKIFLKRRVKALSKSGTDTTLSKTIQR